MFRRSRAGIALPCALLVGAILILGSITHAQPVNTETVELFVGCNNVTLTWPSETPISVVAEAVEPPEVVVAIWRLDNETQIFRAFAPGFPEASDLITVNLLDTVYLCTAEPAVLTRPLPGALAAATATDTPATETATPTPPVVATAPTPPPVTFIPTTPPLPQVRIVSVSETTPRGGSAVLTVAAPPGTLCNISFLPPPGTPLTTTGLGPRVTDRTGMVTWIWSIPFAAPVGPAQVTVICSGTAVTASIQIV